MTVESSNPMIDFPPLSSYTLLWEEEGVIELLIGAIRSYRSSCSAVTAQWLVSGNFDPTRPPDTLKSGSIVHACRSVGRIRAATLRKLR